MTSNKSVTSKSDRPIAVLWSCELNANQLTQKFEVTDDELSEHQLVLKTICLGVGAKDEVNIVEIVPEDESAPIPIATLQLSILPMTTICGIELTPPVTFRLRNGSGPVYVTGQNMVLEDYPWGEEEEQEEEEEEEQEEEEVETPPKPVKRAASTKKAGLAKKKRVDADKSEEESGEEQPVKKGKESSKVKKGAAKK
ncbi:nucleoplasmin-2b [Chiloscyllium plagiosum]|uniref:nucleoplasmin-2b n=1 Tax=Chiloscyllium plagiosum TaxID=36176 RepID=UPI001CB7EA0A|nr:nucleoplasmin-2b [Chiloscyllium plagiosum]